MLTTQKEVTLQKNNWLPGSSYYSILLLLLSLCTFCSQLYLVICLYLQFSPQDSTKVMVTCADSQVRILQGLNVIGKYKGMSPFLVLISSYNISVLDKSDRLAARLIAYANVLSIWKIHVLILKHAAFNIYLNYKHCLLCLFCWM